MLGPHAAGIARETIALTAIWNALKPWLSNIETPFNSNMDPARKVIALEELNISALAEASGDLVRLLARLMSNLVTAKRA